jgi:predicted ABC-type ATPase
LLGGERLKRLEKEETRAMQIRFPRQMYETLKFRAAKEHRSLNGEVVFSLQFYIEAIIAIEKTGNSATAEGFEGEADA